ncbi:MAG: rsmC [Caulobacter sp.]|nr:rsmC [Caulobacter sp.]
MTSTSIIGLYGSPPLALSPPRQGAQQLSPLLPGSTSLEDLGPGGLSEITLLAPPGTVERRYTLALALKALAVGGRLIAMAPKDKGGSRLKGELEALGCEVNETSKAHHRICTVIRGKAVGDLEAAIAEGALQFVEPIGLWSQPGVFSWNRIDPGSAFLVQHLPVLAGKGADLGSGTGYLAKAVLAASPVGKEGDKRITRLILVDMDRRAIEASKRNVDDPRAEIVWADVRGHEMEDLDFVVMNPPFHDGGAEDKALGQQFIVQAHRALHNGGTLWLVANRHLPYEGVLGQQFKHVSLKAETGGFKVYEARK